MTVLLIGGSRDGTTDEMPPDLHAGGRLLVPFAGRAPERYEHAPEVPDPAGLRRPVYRRVRKAW